MSNKSSIDNVAILGASSKPDRYAFKAQSDLMKHGKTVFPVSLKGEAVLDTPGYRSLSEISEPIDTITLYMGAMRWTPIIEEIIAANPRRVILNPGTESEEGAARLVEEGIEVVEGCTLVMLAAGTY